MLGASMDMHTKSSSQVCIDNVGLDRFVQIQWETSLGDGKAQKRINPS